MYEKEHKVISQQIYPDLTRSLGKIFGGRVKARAKSHELDIVSQLDLSCEKVISETLKKSFPDDFIVSEEGNPADAPASGRVWIVDPLCGSGNAAHGIKFFCSNIALAEDGEVRAAWVIDHSKDELIWSVGEKTVSVGERKLAALSSRSGNKILGVDLGYFGNMTEVIKERYASVAKDILKLSGYSKREFATSLAFAYVATAQLEAEITLSINSWDAVAAAFLVEQNGGVVTTFAGKKWDLSTKSFIYAGNKKIHAKFLELVSKNRLTEIV